MGHCAGSLAGPLPPCANNCALPSLHWIRYMASIHDEIDNYLAADLHGQLLEDEQTALHTHLVECATCRKAHQETKAMNKILEETLAQEKPDPAFEQRMLASFRNREYAAEEQSAAQPAQLPLSSSNEVGALSKSGNRRDNEPDQLAVGKSFARGQVAAAAAAPQAEAKDKKQE